MKRLKYSSAALLCGFSLLAAPCISADAMVIESAQALMPEISVYVHDSDENLVSASLEDLNALLDGKPLSVEACELSEEGIYYIFMFDISKSISEEYIASAKQALMKTTETMRPQDKLAVISFGTEVHTLLTGGESEEEVSRALDTIHSTDQYTNLYAAMDTLVSTALASPDMRYIAVIVSDGVDDAQDTVTRDELEATLQKSGVPIYALSADSADDKTKEVFTQFVELSGGKAFSFNPENVASSLSSLMDCVDQVYKLTLTADESYADGDIHPLSVSYGDGEAVTVDIQIDKTAEEYARPEVSGYSINNDAQTVTVSFTKAITNLSDTSCFALSSGDSIASMNILETTEDSLTFTADIFDGGSWTLSIAGLVDASDRQNTITPLSLPLEGLEAAAAPAVTESSSSDEQGGTSAPEEIKDESVSKSSITDYLPLLAIPLVAVLVILLIFLRKGKGGSGKKTSKGQKQSVQFYFEDEK